MATLSKHGRELARIEFAMFTKVFCEDGKILKNHGGGWKIAARVKPGFDPDTVAKNAVARNREKLEACPNWARFMKLATQWSVKRRWMLVTAIEMMPNDPDGVWSTMDDHGISMCIDDVVELCEAWRVGQQELQVFLKARREAATK